MRLTLTSGQPRRRAARLTVAFVAFIATSAFSVVAAEPAQAAVCQTPAHVYLIKLGFISTPGQAFISPYDDATYTAETVPTGTFRSNSSQVQLGGNGIAPGEKITWLMIDPVTGFVPGISPQPPNRAGSNCVVNQSPPTYTVTAAPGTYNLHATYRGGNTNTVYINKWVMRMVVTG